MASRKTSEIQQLQDEISDEIAADAPEIAEMVFGKVRDQPDVVNVTNQRLDQVYREAYLREDRQWLQGEARRDPEQFLKIADRIGVVIPPEMPGLEAIEPGAFAKVAAKQAQPTAPAVPPVMPAAPPMVPPMPPVAPLAPAPAPAGPPLLLGPNGQPLPPSGLV